MKESTTRAPTAPNYGYLWWLEGSGSYAASGIFGQYIYIVPEHRMVVAIHRRLASGVQPRTASAPPCVPASVRPCSKREVTRCTVMLECVGTINQKSKRISLDQHLHRQLNRF